MNNVGLMNDVSDLMVVSPIFVLLWRSHLLSRPVRIMAGLRMAAYEGRSVTQREADRSINVSPEVAA